MPQPEQQTQQQQQQPSNSSLNKTAKKNKKKKSKAKAARSFEKNKLAELYKKIQKELEDEKAKSAGLELKLKEAEKMDLGANEDDESVSSGNISLDSNLTDPDPVPDTVSIDNSSSIPENNTFAPPQTPKQNRTNSSSAPPSSSNSNIFETPAKKLAAVIDNIHIATPIPKPKSTGCLNSDILNEDDPDKGDGTTSSQVSSLESISPLKDSNDPSFVADLHKNSGFFSDINARYCSFTEKMKCNFDKEGCYTCPRCNTKVQYYKKGDTIPILITTSTLARTHTALARDEGVCSHFEIF